MSAPALLPLPCPFCGVEEVIMMHDARGLFWVECFHCNGRTNEHMPTEAEAVAAWNRRAEPSAWQPIALAPHDTKLLLWWPEQEEAYKGFWMNSATGGGGWWVCDGPTPMGKPTHFQPLPAAPKVS